MLSDTQIKEILSGASFRGSGFKETVTKYSWKDSEDKILIFPFEEENLTPVGYDLTVGPIYLSYAQKKRIELKAGQKCVIQPGETVLIVTEEYIGVPKNKEICGLVASKVSQVSRGLSDISTTFDHDYEGRLLIGLTNHQRFSLTLERGEQFATLMFFRSTKKATGACDKPAGRVDIMIKRLDEWLTKAESAEEKAFPSRWYRHLPNLSSLAAVLVFSGIGIAWYAETGNIEGFVALGVAIAAFIRDPVRHYVQNKAAIKSGNGK